MNLLVQFLRTHAGALPDVDPSEDAPYELLAGMGAEDERLGPLLRAAALDPLIAGELASSFAGVAGLDEWDVARDTGAAEWAPPSAHCEWVAIVPVPGRDYGLTLPDDRLPDLRISLFRRHQDVVRRISVVVVPGERPTLELRLAGGECGVPYRGFCGGGSCTNCRQAWIGRPESPAGYACRCEDELFAGIAEERMQTDADVVEALGARQDA